MSEIADGRDYATHDSLGLGGLLSDTYRMLQLLCHEYDVCIPSFIAPFPALAALFFLGRVVAVLSEFCMLLISTLTCTSCQ